MAITAQVEKLTPKKAAEYLSRQMPNRHVTMGIVRDMATAIQENRFVLSGEPIIFSRDEQLINGQHRCRAVLQANKTIDILVVRGIDPVARTVMDTGRKRVLSDVLSMNGGKNATILASIVSSAWHYDNKPLHWLHYSLPNDIGLTVYCADIDGFDEAAAHARSCSRGILTPKAAGFLLYETELQAHDWLRNIREATHLEPSTGAHALRKRIDQEMAKHKTYLRFPVCAALMIKAYVADARGKVLKSLKFGEGETYPRLPLSLAPRAGRHIDHKQQQVAKISEKAKPMELPI